MKKTRRMSGSLSRQMYQSLRAGFQRVATSSVDWLIRQWRGREPRRVSEVEEVEHRIGRCIARGERRHSEARFDQLQDRRVIALHMRDVVFLDPWRHDD